MAMVAKSSHPLMQLMGVQPVLPAPFPTLDELMTPATESVSASSSTPGLFSNLVGDPAILLNDLVRDPKKYDPGVEILLQELLSGQKSLKTLDRDDMEMLDRATLDLSRSSSSEPVKPLQKATAAPMEPPAEMDTGEIDLSGLDPYWFER